MSNLTTVSSIAAAHRLRSAYRGNVNVGTPLGGWAMIVNRMAGVIEPAAVMAAPTTATTCDRTTTGALALPPDPGGGHVFRLRGIKVGPGQGALPPGCLVLCDRYAEVGNLSWATAASQAISLPSLPARAPSGGEGVWIGLEVQSPVPSATTQTLTTTYTNQAGTTGRTIATSLTADGKMAPNVLILPLAAGDTGAQTITSAQWGVAPSATAGAFGYCLLEPLAFFDTAPRTNQANPVGVEIADWLDCAIARIHPQACLELLYISTVGVSNVLTIDLDLVID